jgi:pimeloyl-ACP methyl ester carboxylesterase
MRYTPTVVLVAITLAAVSCTDNSPLAPASNLRTVNAAITESGTSPWTRVVEGETGPGSLYALYIPEHWNGEAVYYAHGVRPPVPFAPISLADQDNFFEVRDALGELGYAFAYSSFSENGLAIKDGAQRTHQLRGLLTSELGQTPHRNYLAGYSLGAAVALKLGEQFPREYDGVLAMCGLVGGTPLELQYIGDVRALFDYYYPAVFPESNVISVTAPLTPDQVAARVIPAVSANPMGMFAIASTAQTPLAYAPIGNLTDNPPSVAFQTMLGSLIYALAYQQLGATDALEHTHGHSPYGNRSTVYSLGSPVIPAAAAMLQALIAGSNQGVARYDSPTDAQNYLEKYYVPTGKLQIPTVSVHNVFDPLVPFFHEGALTGIVRGAGALNMLLQRAVPNYGHCNFSTPLVVGSFQTLATWVNTGVKPDA